ncbi:hypothetical protein ACFYKX_05310 [Cytobacillus sp. FJAT-54145]|uniref:DUF3955 domain-containing protein n=1 Tax=Cytobacillus spartinae TaxID=3299023 RepID=A0ABW6K9U0_9BACI
MDSKRLKKSVKLSIGATVMMIAIGYGFFKLLESSGDVGVSFGYKGLFGASYVVEGLAWLVFSLVFFTLVFYLIFYIRENYRQRQD